MKTEVLNWQGGSVYSTTVNTYNARDQVTLVRQYTGPEGSATFQDTTMTYDGYGRLKTKHVPEQNAGTATTWDYNSDDTIQKITDARGSISNFSYNSRHLTTGMTYDPSAGIADTASVTFVYDVAGNRTSMTDGLGSMSYNYDQLSRLLSETRNFTGLGNHTINYQYNLAGELSSITDPFNATINYTRDSSGRLTGISGTPFGGITTYASEIEYRAWGAIKHLNSGDARTLDASFNSRLQTSAFTVSGKISKTYDYYADGSLRFSSDLLDHRFDRFYSFDHLNRLKEAFSGAEARGEAATTDRPYKQTYGYDAFSHLTARTTKIWGTADNSISDSYVNNRHVPVGTQWQYDADGRLLNGAGGFYTYDAAGHNTHVEIPSTHSSHATLGLDGDGRQIKTEETTWNEGLQTEVTETKYYLRSSVLGGQVLTELGETGGQSRTFVYAGRAVLAWQWRSFGSESVDWEHKDHSGASVRRGSVGQELDPTGADAGTNAQTIIPDEGALISSGSSYNAANPGVTYTVDGVRVSLDDFIHLAGLNLGVDSVLGRSGSSGPMNRNPVWVPDDSLDTADVDLENNTVTIRAGGGGHFEWFPGVSIRTSIPQRGRVSQKTPHRLQIHVSKSWPKSSASQGRSCERPTMWMVNIEDAIQRRPRNLIASIEAHTVIASSTLNTSTTSRISQAT